VPEEAAALPSRLDQVKPYSRTNDRGGHGRKTRAASEVGDYRSVVQERGDGQRIEDVPVDDLVLRDRTDEVHPSRPLPHKIDVRRELSDVARRQHELE
jgi:hypothetical protein